MKTLTLLFISLLSTTTVDAQLYSTAWAKTLGGGKADDAKAITVDNAGNVITGGQFGATVDFDPGPGISNLTATGPFDGYVLKLNSLGGFVWAKRIGNSIISFPNALASDAAGNIYVTGTFTGTIDADPGAGIYNLTGAGLRDGYLIKLNAAGNFVWARSMGGSGNDYYQSLKADAAGNVYATGFFENAVDFDPGSGNTTFTSAGLADIFVTKLNSSGNFLWAKRLGSTGDDHGMSIDLDTSGKVSLSGYFTGTVDFDPGAGTVSLISLGAQDWFLVRLDPSGNYLWAKSFGDPGVNTSIDIASTRTGNVYLTGQLAGTIDLDPGPSTSILSSSNAATFVLKLNASGDFVWAGKFEGNSPASRVLSHSIAVDTADNVYIAGGFDDSVDFDPGPNTNTMVGKFGEVFVSKINRSGFYVWGYHAGGSTGNEAATGVALSPNANVYASGFIYSTIADFEPGEDTLILRPRAGDIFIVMLDQGIPAGGVGIHPTSQSVEPALQLYPNPVAGTATLRSTVRLERTTVAICNVQGQLLQQWTGVSGHSHVMDLSSHPAGTYFLELSGNGSTSRLRLLKQ